MDAARCAHPSTGWIIACSGALTLRSASSTLRLPPKMSVSMALGLPPGKDHVHQIVFLLLALPFDEFFPPRRA